MKFFTNTLKLDPPRISPPQNLLQLSQELGEQKDQVSSLLEKIKQKPNHEHRLIEDIIACIQEDKLSDISLIEWVYCLSTKSQWDKIHPQESESTSEKIWQFAQEYNPLKQRLFWQMVLYHFDRDEMTLAPSIAQTFSTFEAKNKQDYITLKIIDLLIEKNYVELALLCLKDCQQPDQLLYQYSLPSDISIEEDNEINLVETIQSHYPIALNKIKDPQPEQINFLISTLDKLKITQQAIAVEKLLQYVPPSLAGEYPKLVSWVKNNFILSATHQLSNQSKRLFKKWIGAINYKDFAQFIDLIIDRISIDSLEDQQLNARKIFWSNYSDRFMRFKILLPFSTIQAFDNDFELDEITQLINDGSESTEVCIIDIETHFAVEFLRGKGAEVRIFAKDNQNQNKEKSIEQELFNAEEISLKKIRYLSTDFVNIHDRCEYWQSSFEELLRNNNIIPNEGLKYFAIDDQSKKVKYNFDQQLLTLNKSQINYRNRQLIEWQQDIKKLEQDAIKYCQREAQRWKSDNVLIFKNNNTHDKSFARRKRPNLDFID